MLYLQLPLDLIPDAIPLIGQLDDSVARLVAVVGLALLGCSAGYLDSSQQLLLRWPVSPWQHSSPAATASEEAFSIEPDGQQQVTAGAGQRQEEEEEESGGASGGAALVLASCTAAAIGLVALPALQPQLVDNLVGLATGRLRIVNIGGERTITAAY
eukprot:COSAG06_NODE_639_length_13521_cov_26.104455_4_plen_157_part_00